MEYETDESYLVKSETDLDWPRILFYLILGLVCYFYWHVPTWLFFVGAASQLMADTYGPIRKRDLRISYLCATLQSRKVLLDGLRGIINEQCGIIKHNKRDLRILRKKLFNRQNNMY